MSMEKNIKDYLHLYLGCDVMCIKDMPETYGWINGLAMTMDKNILWDMYEPVFFAGKNLGCFYDFIHPILRPLSDMTEEESEELNNIEDDRFDSFDDKSAKRRMSMTFQATAIKYLLSKHFDLFGLIEAGLAIDKTKL